MNKKGFTLIELLVTIGLIAIISTLIVVNMTGMQTKESSAEYTKFQDQLTSAGCSFIDADINNISRVKCKNGATCQVPLSLLVSEGLIDAETIDPQTKKKVSEEQDNIYINVAWTESNGYKEKTCSFVSGTISKDLPTNITSAPVCKNPEVPTSVQIDPVTITYGCSDTSVDGCLSKDETKTYTETTKETLKWTIEDYYNLKTDCSYDINLTIDNTVPTIKNNADTLYLGTDFYDFKTNVTATFGPAGGNVTCNPSVSLKTGSYNVTCNAAGNNGLSTPVTFLTRHSYAASCWQETYSYNDNCHDCCWTSGGHDCCSWSWDGGCGGGTCTPTQYCTGHWNCGGDQHCGTCCDTHTGTRTVCSCPQGGSLSGATCNY